MDQNFIPASEARKLAEERLVIFRNERKDNIMKMIKEKASEYGRFQITIPNELYWDEDIYNFFTDLGYEIEVHRELIVISWAERRSI